MFRGVATARRVACLPLDSPTSFDIIVVPPVPDPGKTTRERFAVHSQDSLCQLCHSIIDPLGFSFEHFDGMGGFRSRENGHPVDSAVVVSERTAFDGRYADSNQLAAALARSEIGARLLRALHVPRRERRRENPRAASPRRSS